MAKDLLEYDDSDAIKFILEHLKKQNIDNVCDDDVQYILDLICEYYEKCNLLNEINSEEAQIEESDMINYISAIMKKENVISLEESILEAILDGEYEYGLSIGIYEK
ncbi:MAG: hypothetical protein IKU78_02930 [Paludibacteraceae bacterium]|nr:hypothetical protein [Paludibacteraceae bacterium]